jgi:hypothetical protein
LQWESYRNVRRLASAPQQSYQWMLASLAPVGGGFLKGDAEKMLLVRS